MQYARERFSESLTIEIMPLLRAHYQEVAHFKDIELDPDWNAYEIAEKIGSLRIFTARKDRFLSGYAVFFVRPNPHYKSSVQASQDVLFLLPSMREGMAGYKFIQWCDDQLRAEGVQAVYQHVKLSRNFGGILERMGYVPVDTIYCKRLDKKLWE